MAEGEQEYIKTSKFNSGMLQVFRLNDLWKDANQAAIHGLHKKWNDILDRVWCELAGDVKIKKDKNEKDDFDKFDKLTENYAKEIKGNIKKIGFQKFNNEDLTQMILQKQALIKKEVFLRTLQNAQGKGTAYDDDDDGFE